VYDASTNKLTPRLEGDQAAPAAVAAAPSKAVHAGGYQGVSFETLNPTYYAASPLPVRGKAMYYNPGIMEQVLSYRQALGQVSPCQECVGYVALLRAGDLNRKVWIQWEDGFVEGPFLVIDVAARHHIRSLLGRGWAIDIDYHTAWRHGMNRPLPVTVLASPPAGHTPSRTAADFVMVSDPP
jgi:hypothetical protein